MRRDFAIVVVLRELLTVGETSAGITAMQHIK
jgi:hypothetical protein